MKLRFLGLTVLCLPLAVEASSDVHTKVVGAGLHGNGKFSVVLADVIDEPGCPMKRLDILPTHPRYQEKVSIGLMAAAKGSHVQIKTASCTVGYAVPTLSLGEDTWFFVKD